MPPWAKPGGPTNRLVMMAVPRTSPSSKWSSTSGRTGLQAPMIGLSGMGVCGVG